MSTKVLKDHALETYYQAMFELHGMPGWKYLMEDAGRMLEVHDTVNGIDTEQQLWFRKGELAQMQWLFSQQSMVEAAYAAMIAERYNRRFDPASAEWEGKPDDGQLNLLGGASMTSNKGGQDGR